MKQHVQYTNAYKSSHELTSQTLGLQKRAISRLFYIAKSCNNMYIILNSTIIYNLQRSDFNMQKFATQCPVVIAGINTHHTRTKEQKLETVYTTQGRIIYSIWNLFDYYKILFSAF